MGKQVLTCPQCTVRTQERVEKEGQHFVCPACGVPFKAYKDGGAELVDDPFWPPHRIPDTAEGSRAGRICSLLAVGFGLIAVLVWPLLFGPVGLALGVVGIVLSPRKTVAVAALTAAIVGTISGLVLWGMWIG